MAENQPIEGARWNSEVNKLLASLGWVQLGDSRIDVSCEYCKNERSKSHGLDSVFYYDDPLNIETREGFFVEAKEYAFDNAKPVELQKWYDGLLLALDHLPLSSDFQNKYSPLASTRFTNGLIVAFHHDRYDDARFNERLAKLTLPHRKSLKRIFIISNHQIFRVAAVITEKKRLEESGHEVSFFFPYRAINRVNQSHVLPVEYLFSKFIFIKIRDAANNGSISNAVFYLGNLNSPNLSFVHETLSSAFQTTDTIKVYCSESTRDFRSQIQTLQRNAPNQYEFLKLDITTSLPGWLTDGT